MKNLFKIISLFILIAFLLNPVYAGERDKQVNDVFSKNPVKTLKSDDVTVTLKGEPTELVGFRSNEDVELVVKNAQTKLPLPVEEEELG